MIIDKRKRRKEGYIMSENKILIVAHGDLDGMTSAALLAEQLGIESKDLSVVFTQPFLVDQVVIPSEIEKVYVVDLAVNNRDVEMTARFIERFGDKLVQWIDHHHGWDDKVYDKRFVIDPTAPACAAMLGNGYDTRVQDAIASDTRKLELLPTGQLIDRAIKSDMSEDGIRLWAVKLLMGAEQFRNPLEMAEKAYELVENETTRLSRGFMVDGSICYNPVDNEVIGCVAFVDTTNSTHKYDLTQLLLAGQGLAHFAVVKIVNSRDNEEMITIATKSGVNLVELFELLSGAPFRVTLPVERLEEAVEKIHGLDLFRPCNCGSGEPGSICHADTPYCG